MKWYDVAFVALALVLLVPFLVRLAGIVLEFYWS